MGDKVIGEIEKVIELPKVQNYSDLLVWQQSIELVKNIYQLTQSFPREEIYGLTSQIRRAAVSIPSNIAEGHTRDSLKEYIQFLSIAVGSLAEVRTQMVIAVELGYLSLKDVEVAEQLSIKTLRMLRNLQKSLKEKI